MREPPSRTRYGSRSGSIPSLLQTRQRLVEIIDPDRDVPVPVPELVRTPVVVEGQLELLLASRSQKK